MTVLDYAPPASRPVTAAAIRLSDGVSSMELARQLKRHEAWQADAAGYFSELGEIHYVINRAASALSEARLYCATRSAEGQLVPVDAPESLVSPAVAATATAELAKLRSPVFGQAQLIHQAFVNIEVAGEFFLVDISDDNGPAFWVRSILETKITEPGRPVTIKGIGDVPFDSVSRVWRPHAMRFEAADSGMRPVLGECELVVLIGRHWRAALKSRLFAGVLLMPNSMREGQPDTSQRGDAMADPVVADIIDALSEGIGEEGAASAVVPNIIWGNKDDISAVKLVEFAQRVDPEVLALRDSSIKRIVQGLEYPPEVVTGTGDVSHWGAWFIGDSFIDHIRPKGDFLADAFTTVFLRPGLESAGVSPVDADQVLLAFDYSPLARKPNIVETATLAYDRYVISDESLRRDLGYDDDDAPDPVEVAERVARKAATTAKPGVMTGPPAGGSDTVAASALPDDVGGRLARIDSDLVERLVGATTAAFRRAAELAGNRARGRVASAHRDAVRNVPAADVCAQLGPTLLAAAGMTDDELLAGGFDGLKRDFKKWALAAAAAAYAVVVAEALDDATVAAWEAELAANVEAAWEWFATTLNVTLSKRLMEGADLADSVVRGLVRQAVARAGGVTELAAHVNGSVPVSAVTGIGTGPITLQTLGMLDVDGWRWVHDSPEHPFPPHVALDGAEAATVDEFAISFDGWPGDHAGCACVVAPIVRRRDDG